jgi:glycosyltransferase involved in cell wall biosynthesis
MKHEITYILPDKIGGVASVVLNLLLFKSDLFRTKVILIREKRLTDDYIKYQFPCDNQVIITIDTKRESKYNTAKKIYTQIRNSSLIISNDGGIELSTIELFRLNIPVIYILHGDHKYYYDCFKYRGTIIDGVIGVSNYIAKQAEAIKKEFSFNTRIFSEKFPLLEINQPKFRNNDKICLIYSGALSEPKGVLLFKKVCNILKDNAIPYRFDIIGDGVLKHQLELEFANDRNVFLHGYLSNKEVILKLSYSDIMLFCSHAEGLPVSIVEGMKSEVVPVVSDIPSGIPEIVIDGETGYKAPVGDATSFANRIIFLYENQDILKKMKLKAKERANKMFDPNIQTAKYEQIYEQIINNPNPKVFRDISIKEKIMFYLPGRIRLILLNYRILLCGKWKIR